MNIPNKSPEQPGLAELINNERELISRRRKAAGLNATDAAAGAVGIALSGGGIRSATFCLGLFQGLAKCKLIARIDYLSTVSGGGYFGSFFGRMFTREWARPSEKNLAESEAAPPAGPRNLRSQRRPIALNFIKDIRSEGVIETIETVLKDGSLPPLRWLREGGDYLTPGGSGDAALAAAVFVRNWIAVLVVTLVSLLTVFVGGNFLRAVLNSWNLFHIYEVRLETLTARHLWWSPWWFLPWLVMYFVVAPVGWAFWLTQAGEKRQFACVSIANLIVIGGGVFALLLLAPNPFYWGAIALGAEALLALAWVWLLGAIHCFNQKRRRLLPSKLTLVSTLLVSFLPLLWRVLIYSQWHFGVVLRWEILATVILLPMAVLHHLALRVAAIDFSSGRLRAKLGCWKFSRWKTQWPGMICWAVLVGIVPILQTIWPDWWGRNHIYKLLNVWAIMALLAAPYFLAFQVLSRDRMLSATNDQTSNPSLVHWLRHRLSRLLNYGLITFGTLMALVIINSLGQTLYAVATYKGELMPFLSLISGALGLAGFAPLARAIAIRTAGVRGKLGIPIQILALAGALLLAVCLFVSVSYVAHGIAWRWGCPVLTNRYGKETLGERIGAEWVTNLDEGLTVSSNGPINLADIPGANIAHRWFDQGAVKLNKENLIEVEQAKAENQSRPLQTRMFILDLGLSFALGLALTFLFGRVISFLNLSSFHSFYTARLIRAYQGATNPRRWGLSEISIDDVDSNDDIPWHNYRPYETGGPLHLVNVAVNCTITGETNKESTTAKGINLCVGPSGLSFGHRHALNWLTATADSETLPGSQLMFVEFKLGEPSGDGHLSTVRKNIEPLTLGGWVGVSGAAFTTGLGNVGGGPGTSIGTSFLCGMFNIRLGYWWENDFSPSNLGSSDYFLPMQTYLLDELMGSFHIENRSRWYLSDGGHFENTAAYELIRRRTPFIVISDAGTDPDGQFDDLANLVRRVRLDFGAEIEFCSDHDLRKHVDERILAPSVQWRSEPRNTSGDNSGEPAAIAGRIGVLADLSPQTNCSDSKRVRAHSTVAKIHYAPTPTRGPETGTLLIIKPGITDDLPEDLLNYQEKEPNFPHQTTLEQFFDEAQWESYRKLAEYVSNLIFGVHWKTDGKWCPHRFKAIQWE